MTVPEGCRNGTFWWNYPQGSVILHFPNTNSLSMSICLRDAIGGDIFSVHDITNGQFIPMEIISGRRQHFGIDLTGNTYISMFYHDCKFGNFREGFIFAKLRKCEVSRKQNPRELAKSLCRLLI